MALFIGTAGWALTKADSTLFSGTGTALERYAQVLRGTEINSTFKHIHRPTTFARWAASVPDNFRFAVKLPKVITHDERLAGTSDLLATFLDSIASLGEKLGPMLVQLPPSLALDRIIAERFFSQMRQRVSGPIVCEARHQSWFTADAGLMMQDLGVSRVAADPSPVGDAGAPSTVGPLYLRLHGSPRVYYSSYEDVTLDAFASMIRASQRQDVWCVFDNTASSAAIGDALRLRQRLCLDSEITSTKLLLPPL